jgi:hypothetical protein
VWGIVVIVLVCVFVLALVAFCCRRRYLRKKAAFQAEHMLLVTQQHIGVPASAARPSADQPPATYQPHHQPYQSYIGL